MMPDFKRHLIQQNASLKEALQKLNDLAADAILFVVDEQGRLKGSLTDGDVRRGILRGLTFDTEVNAFIQPNPKFIQRNNYSIEKVIEYRNLNFKILPVVDELLQVINVINFRSTKSYLPVDAVIMAGGRGERLRPLTDTVPKPMLQLGGKPIIRYNLDRLISFGIDDIWISIRYMGDQIMQYLADGVEIGARIQYIHEDKPLGTIGALSMVTNFKHNHVLVCNSDLLTSLDYEHFFLDFIRQDADLAVVTIPYQVNVPYAVLETSENSITSFKEKPTYTYYSNGGIYLMKNSVLKLIPQHAFFNATDLMEKLIQQGARVISYPLLGYWLDIGKHEDFQKAQKDIDQIKVFL